MKFPLLKTTMAGVLAVTICACNDDREQAINDNDADSHLRPRSINAKNSDLRNNDWGSIARPFAGWNRDGWMPQRKNNAVSPHGNTRLSVHEPLADRVAALPGVKSAQVFATERNVYVAVTLDPKGPKSTSGMNNTFGAAERQKNRMNTNVRNLTGHGVTGDMKRSIANVVRASVPEARAIYVSANPDFARRLHGWAADAKRGHPVQGIIIEFNELMDRMFPANAGSINNVVTDDYKYDL